MVAMEVEASLFGLCEVGLSSNNLGGKDFIVVMYWLFR
jgi:hypothetical protein